MNACTEKRLILASASPRRREILDMAGYRFSVISPEADEYKDGSDGRLLAVENSRLKAEAAEKYDNGVYICADTVVLLDDIILGKPHTPSRAREMLTALSGREHSVVTGYTVTDKSKRVSGYTETRVVFRDLTEDEILRYIETGDPLDKAGAYGIQGAAGCFVSSICGDYYTVVGLPLCKISEILRDEFSILPLQNTKKERTL